MLHVTNVSKSYGVDAVLSNISFVLNSGERGGLVGPNGCGKTTLMRIIAGVETPDSGRVRFSSAQASLGYLAQALGFDPKETFQDVLERAVASHRQAWDDMQQQAVLMANVKDEAELARITTAYGQAESRFEAAGGYGLEPRLEAVLAGLGLDTIPRHLPVEHLSGGQKTRLGLAGLLVQQPQLLLLDEPTNHLDIEALDWLEQWLLTYDGAVLLVSHDRAFLDGVTTRTLVIDSASHQLRDFEGTYSQYLETVAHETDQQWQAYKGQQQEIAQLQQAAQHLRGQAKFRRGGKADTPDKFAKGFFSNRSAATIGRAKSIERRIERLQNEEHVDKPGQQWQLKLDFAADSSGARQVLSLEDVAMAFGEVTLFADVNLTLTHGERVTLIGPNGSGKTTLLRLVTGELLPTAGRVQLGAGVKLGYLAQEQEILDLEQTPYDTIRAEAVNMSESDVRTFLHAFLFAGDEVFVQNSKLSFGERTRLMLALLIAQGCNFLLLDEPINHLDIPSRERFEQALEQFNGTILAVVHDRMFIRRVATAIWEIKTGQIKHVII